MDKKNQTYRWCHVKIVLCSWGVIRGCGWQMNEVTTAASLGPAHTLGLQRDFNLESWRMPKRLRRFIFVDDAHSYVFKVFKSFLLYIYLLNPYRGQVQFPVSAVARNSNRVLVHVLNIAPKTEECIVIMFCKLMAGCVKLLLIILYLCAYAVFNQPSRDSCLRFVSVQSLVFIRIELFS